MNDYTGTVLYVSHDRYFINQTATRILDLVNQTFVNYIGNYDYYLEKKEELTNAYSSTRDVSSAPAATAAEPSASKLDWKEQKEEKARERKRQNELKKVEDKIHELETRDGEIDELLSQEDVYTDVSRLMELNKEKESIQKELEVLYEKWEELAE